MKVTALDPETLREASVIASPNASRHETAQLAIRKLAYVLGKQQESE